jgi:hypothetical protein
MDPIKRKPKKGTKNNPVKKGEVTVKPKTKYAPNQDVSKYDSKTGVGRYTMTDKKGNRNWIQTLTPTDQKLYESSGKATYQTGKWDKNILKNPDFKKSMDTTGYAAGKKTFTINSIKRKEGELTKTKSVKVPRSKVLGILDKWKAAASKMSSPKKNVTVSKPKPLIKKSNG